MLDPVAHGNEKILEAHQRSSGSIWGFDTAKLRRDVSEVDRATAVKTVATTHVADGLWMSKAG